MGEYWRVNTGDDLLPFPSNMSFPPKEKPMVLEGICTSLGPLISLSTRCKWWWPGQIRPFGEDFVFFGVRCLDLGVFSFQVEFDAFFLNGSSELFCCRKRNMYIYGLYMSIHILLVELTLMFWRSLWMVVEGCVSRCDSPSSSTKHVRRFCWKFAIFASIILHIYV
jgi:hypothetical protein